MITSLLSSHQQSSTIFEPVWTWKVVRLCINRVADEWHNIGILLNSNKGDQYIRMLSNVAGLRCYYGDDLANDALFLIDQATQALELNIKIPNGWNIKLGETIILGRLATTPEQTLEALYKKIVPLSRKEASQANQFDNDDHKNSTSSVRHMVRELIKKHKGGKQPSFWKARPISLTLNNKEIDIDIQIEGHGKNNILQYGSIASAWYTSDYHRRASLDRATSAILTAKEVYPNSESTVYMLQPSVDKIFNIEEINKIHNDIDNIEFLLSKRSARLKVYETIPEMAHDVLEDMAEL